MKVVAEAFAEGDLFVVGAPQAENLRQAVRIRTGSRWLILGG